MAQETAKLKQSETYDETDLELIRNSIEQTRAHMSNTIDEIQARLSPERLKEQATHSIKEATIGKAEKMAHTATYKANKWSTNVTETVKQNPIPAALVGIGLSWLLVESVRDNGHDNDYYYYPATSPSSVGFTHSEEGVRDRAQAAVTGGLSKAQVKAKEAGNAIAERAGEVANTVQHKADRAAERAGEVASTVQSKAGQAAESVQETVAQQAGALRETTRYQAKEVKRNVQSGFFSNPIAFGAAAAVAGAAIGLMLPATQREDELMGETRDHLVDQAQNLAKDTARKAEYVAREATESAKESAKAEANRQNLSVVS